MTLGCGDELPESRAGPSTDPRAPRRRARPRLRGDHRDDPFQGGSRGRLARPLHARTGARGHLWSGDVLRAGSADPDGGGGCRLRARQRPHGRCRARIATETTMLLAELLDELPEDLARQVLTHASWSERRGDSYTRLAFLGDSVLALAVTSYLYPRLEAERFGAGRLTKIRAQAVSGRSCKAVAQRLGIPERLRAAAPPSAEGSVRVLIGTERVLASVIEAGVGACFLLFG